MYVVDLLENERKVFFGGKFFSIYQGLDGQFIPLDPIVVYLYSSMFVLGHAVSVQS